MTPALVQDSPEAPSSPVGHEKPTVYLLDDFHPEVMAYCKRNFNAITRTHPGHGRWREEARYLLVRGSRRHRQDRRRLLLHRKTVGILGMGNIGRQVAGIFRGGFEADVVAYDPFLPADAWADIPHTRAASVDEVLRSSDVVTVHMPLTPETRGLISYEQMRLMRKTAILINTARGGIISETDLERALSEGLIWGAGLDCHEEEPPSKERYGRLWELGVVSTPHIGAATGETQMQTGIKAAERIMEFIEAERKQKQ
ncbi:hypothetical protein RB600_006227 [Gaeumannomyces tritici]